MIPRHRVNISKEIIIISHPGSGVNILIKSNHYVVSAEIFYDEIKQLLLAWNIAGLVSWHPWIISEPG